jgi:hypothetical protein
VTGTGDAHNYSSPPLGMQPEVRDDFLSDYCAVQESIRSGVVPSRPPKPPILGGCGWTSAKNIASTRGSPPIWTHSHSSKCSDGDMDKDDSRPATSPCELAQWLMPYEWLDEDINNWGPETSKLADSPDSLTSVYNDK